MAAKTKTAAKAAPESKALTVTDRAVAALGYNVQTVKELTKLAGESTHITAITNKAGYEQVHGARMALKNRRLEITKAGKEAREDAQDFCRAVIAEEKRLVAIIQPEELRLQGLQDAHDAEIERQKREAAEAEQRRAEGHVARVNALRAFGSDVSYRDAPETITLRLQALDALTVDEGYEEFQQQAQDAKAAATLRLAQAFKDAIERVASEKRQAERDAELEQLRAEKAERDRQDRERREAEERAAQARRDEIERVERNRLAAERAAQAPSTDAQLANLQQQADVTPVIEQTKPPACFEPISAPRQFRIRPTLREIVVVIVNHYNVDEETALNWLDRAVRGDVTRAA